MILDAALDYAELGVVPNFENNIPLAICWDFLQPKIDRDQQRYEAAIAKKKYAVYVREEKKTGRSPVEFEEWLETLDVI